MKSYKLEVKKRLRKSGKSKLQNGEEVETYTVCEKDEKYALELLKKAMEVARDNMKGIAQVELLEKCNKLNEKLGVSN